MLQMQLIWGTWLWTSYPILGFNIILIGAADSLVPSSYLCLFAELETSFALKRFPMLPLQKTAWEKALCAAVRKRVGKMSFKEKLVLMLMFLILSIPCKTLNGDKRSNPGFTLSL